MCYWQSDIGHTQQCPCGTGSQTSAIQSSALVVQAVRHRPYRAVPLWYRQSDIGHTEQCPCGTEQSGHTEQSDIGHTEQCPCGTGSQTSAIHSSQTSAIQSSALVVQAVRHRPYTAVRHRPYRAVPLWYRQSDIGHTQQSDIGHTQQCPCGTGNQTSAGIRHRPYSSALVVQAIRYHNIYELLRKGIWPDHTPIASKLYGSLVDLQCTATFIEETGVSI